MEERGAISMLNLTAQCAIRTIKRTTIFDNKPLDRRKHWSLRHMAWCIFFIFSLFWTCVSSSEIACPSVCTCTYSERLVDCSKRSLKKIPTPLPTWVSKLTFQNNKLVATEIKEEIFSNLINLKELDFSDNPLEEVNVALRGLPKLRVLRFDRCALLRIPNVGSVTGSNLHHLSLARNRITAVGDRLKRFPSLRILNLSHNKLQRNLPGKSFSHQRNLTHLYLQRNKITGFEANAFQGLTSLETLSLARNKIRGLRHLCMSGSKETGDCGDTFRRLKFIDLSKNLLTRIEGLAFQGLTSLNVLLLNNNQINTLMDGAFVTLNSLSTLKLDNNRIPRVSKTWLFDLKSLQTLSLSHNNITAFDRQGWKFCKAIKHLNLSFNSLTILHTENFSPLEGLKSLNLSHNSIVVIEDHAFRNLLTLEALDLSHNRISSSVEDINGAFLGLSSLRSLRLQDNKIRSFSSSMLRGAENLEELDIRRNNLTTVQNDSFSILSNLKVLAMKSSSFLCDCQLTWFSEWLRNHHGDNMTSQVDVRCFHPPPLKNRKVEDVKPQEFECGEHPVPALLQQPSLLTSPSGGNVTLQCSASATLTGTTTDGDVTSVFMTVVWRRGEARDVISESESVRILNQQKQEGGHIFFTSFLLLYNVNFNDDEEYRCVISNEFGHAMSTPARLNVYSVPVIRQKPTSKVVKYGGEVIMPCQVSGFPLPKVSWTKEGEKNDFPAAKESRLLVGELEIIPPPYHSPLDDNSLLAEDFLGRRGGGLSPDTGGESRAPKPVPKLAEMAAPLHITKLKPEDAGVYTCTAESSVGVESWSATLTVLYPPIVDSMPEVTQSVRGGHAVLKCMASAYPQPEITWYVDGGVLNGTTRHFFAADGKILVIVDARETDEGQYTCAVRNDLGETKQTTRLILVDSLDIDDGSGDFDNFFGTNGIVVLAVFVCIVLTSLVWLLVLCHTKKGNDGALSGYTDATDVASPIDSSSHGSLERGHSHSMQCMSNINHSRYDVMSRYLDPTKNCIQDASSCYQDPGPVIQQHPDQFRSVPRNYSTRFPLTPHHLLPRTEEKLRMQRGLPLRSASTPHVYGLDRPLPRGKVPLTRPPLHGSSHCVGNPPCREQQHRLPACRSAAQSKRRKRRRRLLEQGEEHRESGGGSSRMTYSSSSESEFEKQPLMSVISSNGACTSTARVIPTKNVEYDPRKPREQSVPADTGAFTPGKTSPRSSNLTVPSVQDGPADESEPVPTSCFRNDVDLSSANSESLLTGSPWKQKSLSNDS